MRVWYEPSEGVRFAGVVVGDGTLPNTKRVKLAAAYWHWRGCGAPPCLTQPAVGSGRLFPRDTEVPRLDA